MAPFLQLFEQALCSTGTLAALRGASLLRLAFCEGDCVGRDRHQAVARMQRALDEFTIVGVTTNIPAQEKIMAAISLARVR